MKEHAVSAFDRIVQSVHQSRRARTNQFDHNRFYVNPNTMQRSRLAATEGVSATPQLLIDLLLSSSAMQYPPKDLDGLLSVYLLNAPNIARIERHLIVLYWLHDLVAATGAPAALVDSFCNAFFIAENFRKMMHAFWSLDNGFTTEAFAVLCEPDVSTEWILHCVRALRDLGAPREALALYRAKRAMPKHLDEAQLVCEVLLCNGLLAEAFLLQRRLVKSVDAKAARGVVDADAEAGNTSSSYRATLFGTILSQCGVQSADLELLLQMPLDAPELQLVETFLRNHPDQQRATDVLLVVYLQRNQYKQAVDVYDQTLLKQLDTLDSDNARFRKALVDNALQLIPPRQRAAVDAMRPTAPVAGAQQRRVAATPAKGASKPQLYPDVSVAVEATPKRSTSQIDVPRTPVAPLPLSPLEIARKHARPSPIKATPSRPLLPATPASARMIAIRSIVSPTVVRSAPLSFPSESSTPKTPAVFSLYPSLTDDVPLATTAPPFLEAPPPAFSLLDEDAEDEMVVDVPEAVKPLPSPAKPAPSSFKLPPATPASVKTVVYDVSTPPSQAAPSPTKRLLEHMAKPAGAGAAPFVFPRVPTTPTAQSDAMQVDDVEAGDDNEAPVITESNLDLLAKIHATLSQSKTILDKPLTHRQKVGAVAPLAKATTDPDDDDDPIVLVSSSPAARPHRRLKSNFDLEEDEEDEEENGDEEDMEEEAESDAEAAAALGADSGEDSDREVMSSVSSQRKKPVGLELVSAPSFLPSNLQKSVESDEDADDENEGDVEGDGGDERLMSVSQRDQDDEQNLDSADEEKIDNVDLDDDNVMKHYAGEDSDTSDDEAAESDAPQRSSRRVVDTDSRPSDAMEVDEVASAVSDGASSIGAGAIPSSIKKERKQKEDESDEDHDDSEEEPSRARSKKSPTSRRPPATSRASVSRASSVASSKVSSRINSAKEPESSEDEADDSKMVVDEPAKPTGRSSRSASRQPSAASESESVESAPSKPSRPRRAAPRVQPDRPARPQRTVTAAPKPPLVPIATEVVKPASRRGAGKRILRNSAKSTASVGASGDDSEAEPETQAPAPVPTPVIAAPTPTPAPAPAAAKKGRRASKPDLVLEASTEPVPAPAPASTEGGSTRRTLRPRAGSSGEESSSQQEPPRRQPSRLSKK